MRRGCIRRPGAGSWGIARSISAACACPAPGPRDRRALRSRRRCAPRRAASPIAGRSCAIRPSDSTTLLRRARGRWSCRRARSARRSSCWPSCRPPWRGWPTTRPARSAGRAACSAAFRSSSTTPGCDARPALVGIDLQHAVQVLRGVEDQPRADRLAGLRRAAAPRRDRHAVPSGIVTAARRPRRSGNHHAERLDLVDAGVGGIERARRASKRTSPSSAARSSRCSASAIGAYWLFPRAAIGHTASTSSPRSA